MTPLFRHVILIIEDEQSVALLFAAALREAGFATTISNDAEDGLSRLQRQEWSCVVCDLCLPDSDGFETIQRVSAVARVPIVVVTGDYSRENELRAMREYGVQCYLAKPTDINLLVRAVQVAIARWFWLTRKEQRIVALLAERDAMLAERRRAKWPKSAKATVIAAVITALALLLGELVKRL